MSSNKFQPRDMVRITGVAKTGNGGHTIPVGTVGIILSDARKTRDVTIHDLEVLDMMEGLYRAHLLKPDGSPYEPYAFGRGFPRFEENNIAGYLVWGCAMELAWAPSSRSRGAVPGVVQRKRRRLVNRVL